MSEQQTVSACPHPEAVGTRWGDPISEERQAELQSYLDRWEAKTDHDEDRGKWRGPFSRAADGTRLRLTGADVFWLAEQVIDSNEFVPNLHLERADISNAHLERAKLIGAHLEGADFRQAHLERADLST